jgi:two-component system, cell cycle sensor histidine kinase PleC
MPSTVIPRAPSDMARESRIQLALLRGVAAQLRPNRLLIPLFAALVCGMFAQWLPFKVYSLWYALVLLTLMPSLLQQIPAGELTPEQVRYWSRAVSLANLVFVLGWTSLGWFLWVPGNDFNHILIQLVLAATLASHAGLVGTSREISRPAFAAFGLAMTLTPLQAQGTAYEMLAFVSPFYVLHVALIARQSHARARAALMLEEDKNALLAELTRAKKESDEGREQAEAASLAKSQFLANMSHELRTPLNAIIGFSELITTRLFAALPERNYEYAGLIHSSGHHLLALINDILDLAKIEAGRFRLSESEIDFRKIAGDALHLVVWKARENGASLTTEFDAGLPGLYADERAVKQILLNLLSNAVKFTPRGGAVTAFARADESGFYFGVTDTGIGISSGDQAKVFDSFGRATG